MRKCDMRKALDIMIEDMEKSLVTLRQLRAEMHNRPPKTHGRVTSKKVDRDVKREILEIFLADPGLPQHEIAKIVGTGPGRVSETIAGKRY